MGVEGSRVAQALEWRSASPRHAAFVPVRAQTQLTKLIPTARNDTMTFQDTGQGSIRKSYGEEEPVATIMPSTDSGSMMTPSVGPEGSVVEARDAESCLAAERYRVPGLHVPITSRETLPAAVYYDQLETLREIIHIDYFCGEMPSQIVDAWVGFLGGRRDIPTDNVKGIYGQPLAYSASIELARGPLKYIIQATDPGVNAKYSARALLALGTLGDLHALEQKNPLITAIALRQKLVALARKPDGLHELQHALAHYTALRPTLDVADSKLPQADEMARRCVRVARELNYGEYLAWFTAAGFE